MNIIYKAVVCLALLLTAKAGVAQWKPSAPARYFRLTLNFKSSSTENQQDSSQTISTEVGVRPDTPGSCRARLTFQVPRSLGAATKYVELGTKLDCNDVHIEGDALALQLALDSSRVVQMIKVRNSGGVEVDEPLIAQRVVQLTVRLPLDHPKVVFDSSSKPAGPTKAANQDPPLIVEMTASELK